ncbi:MAG: hypothetical protein ACOYEG_04590 [Petrimonas sp.]|jgi:hypothetical protein
MKNLFYIPLFLLFVTACSQKTIDCKCFHGIGSSEKDTPIQTIMFSNRKSVSVCGYKDNDLISEFNVFDCETGESLAEYGALSSCLINFQDDKLIITEVLSLPNNENWEYKNVPFAEEVVKPDGNNLMVEKQKPLKITLNVSEQEQNEYLNTLEPLNLKTEEITEDLLFRLELMALGGNQKAEIILRNMENVYSLDGHAKEIYNSAIEHIDFIRNK